MDAVYLGAWPGADGAARIVRRSRATNRARRMNPAIITTGGLENWRGGRRASRTGRDRSAPTLKWILTEICPDCSTAAATQNGGCVGAVNPSRLRPSAGGEQRTRSGEVPHATYRSATGVQGPLSLTARVMI
ncbi:hypothetical protein NDU88_002455 [Pleurodeles waltl]|uniref:Uncharacterized protein n=1 Tax=Pleurodeles waltl TaxID=8319 RepID=A0AAV7LE80_PLEWA|nr:hypothetical protein NDU88_002455 [Pleurodeles waltl]